MRPSTISLTLTLAFAAASSHAGYIGSVSAHDGGDSIDVLPGGVLSFRLDLAGDAGIRHDSAIFRLISSVEGLLLEDGWYEWGSPFETSGLDDYSSPGSDAAGVWTAGSYADPFDVSSIDLYFENLTPQLGNVFNVGTLIEFRMRLPDEWGGPDQFTIAFAPDTFADGAALVAADAGGLLMVNVIPAPGAMLLIGLCAAWPGAHRRRELCRHA